MISIIKLVNGIEVIGDIISDESNIIIMKNPLQINYRYKNEFSPPVISLTRYSSFAETRDVLFKKENVMNTFTPIVNMIKYYNTSLKNIEQHIDPSVMQELNAAAGEDDQDLSPESQAKLALIERHVTKATLN